jgi:hypothetical protein
MGRFLIGWFAIISAPLVQSAEVQVATPAMSSKAPQPRDPQAAVPPTIYHSAFGGYRTSSDDTVIPWREANDVVRRIGGWRVYAREAQEPTSPAAVPATPVPHKH